MWGEDKIEKSDQTEVVSAMFVICVLFCNFIVNFA